MTAPRSEAPELPTSSPTLSDLARIASDFDVTLHMAHLEHGVLGFYEPSEARIYFAFGLTYAERRSVIAHELAHVYRAHECSTPSAERDADTLAAQLLIEPEAYAAAEQISSDAHHIAETLDVTVELVHHYRQHCIHRIGSRTYGRQLRGRFTNRIARMLS